MKRLACAGCVLAVMGSGVWATYGDFRTSPVYGHAPVEARAEPLARPVLRLEGLVGSRPVERAPTRAVRVLPSGSTSPDLVGEAEEPL